MNLKTIPILRSQECKLSFWLNTEWIRNHLSSWGVRSHLQHPLCIRACNVFAEIPMSVFKLNYITYFRTAKIICRRKAQLARVVLYQSRDCQCLGDITEKINFYIIRTIYMLPQRKDGPATKTKSHHSCTIYETNPFKILEGPITLMQNSFNICEHLCQRRHRGSTRALL